MREESHVVVQSSKVGVSFVRQSEGNKPAWRRLRPLLGAIPVMTVPWAGVKMQAAQRTTVGRGFHSTLKSIKTRDHASPPPPTGAVVHESSECGGASSVPELPPPLPLEHWGCGAGASTPVLSPAHCHHSAHLPYGWTKPDRGAERGVESS